MQIDILTLFPDIFKNTLEYSIIKKACEKGIVKIKIHNIRDYTYDKHKTADDCPYGGGEGMVLKPEPIFEAISCLLTKDKMSKKQFQLKLKDSDRIIVLSPSGKKFTQSQALELSKKKHLMFICGHYEEVDERVRKFLATDDVSIGDYILSGGEFACMVVIDAIVRLLPNAVGNEKSILNESFSQDLLDYPQYTRPDEYLGLKVPEVLLSGNHEKIKKWRRQEQIKKTLINRPDLLEQANLSKEDKELLKEIKKEG
ncbi:MAG: tRNA (guanosine(37)-N1)-methyltransferase TrmD [Candidatus Firestonebacteria bacterium]